jgi:hypothetical protein
MLVLGASATDPFVDRIASGPDSTLLQTSTLPLSPAVHKCAAALYFGPCTSVPDIAYLNSCLLRPWFICCAFQPFQALASIVLQGSYNSNLAQAGCCRAEALLPTSRPGRLLSPGACFAWSGPTASGFLEDPALAPKKLLIDFCFDDPAGFPPKKLLMFCCLRSALSCFMLEEGWTCQANQPTGNHSIRLFPAAARPISMLCDVRFARS